MLGPFLTFKDSADLNRLLDHVRAQGVRVNQVENEKIDSFFRFRKGLVSAVDGCITYDLKEPCIYLGCTHWYNPLLWWPEVRLLDKIKEAMLDAGSCEYEARPPQDTPGG